MVGKASPKIESEIFRNFHQGREVLERERFEQARLGALTRLRKGLELKWTPPTSREELYERWSSSTDV